MNGIGTFVPRLASAAAQRLARWTSQPYLTLLIAATVALTLIDGFVSQPSSHLVMPMAVLIALLVAETYWWPASCALAIIAVSMAVVVAPRVVLPIPVWALWYVYGMLAYRRRYAALACALLLGIAGTVTGVMLDRYPLWNVSTIVSLNGSFVLAAIAGLAMVERRDVERARRLAEENARMRRDVELGSRIHDTVTQGLTVIALTGERLRGELAGGDGRDAAPRDAALHDAALRDVKTIVTAADATLAQVRTVIDALGGSDAGGAVESAHIAESAHVVASAERMGRDRLTALREAAKIGDDRLRALGFAGHTTVGIAGDFERSKADAEATAADAADGEAIAARRLAALSSEAWRELDDLLGQLVTNVIVHADPRGGDYAIDVAIGTDAVTVTQSNAVRDDSAAASVDTDADVDASASSVPHAGRGLALHRARLMAFGGDLHASAEDGAWILVARIPSSEQRADDGTRVRGA